jgi:hypothetical protein
MCAGARQGAGPCDRQIQPILNPGGCEKAQARGATGDVTGMGRERTLVVIVFLAALAALFALRAATTPHYRLSAHAAIAAARAEPQTAAYLRTHPTTTARSIPLDREDRRVTFFDGQRIVLDVAVGPDGELDSREEHPAGVPELGSELAHRWWMLALLTAVFLAAVVVVPLRRMANLDALALAGFAGTVVLLDQRLVAASVALGSLLLAYLAARCFYVGLRESPEPREETPLLGTPRILRWVAGGTLLMFLAVTLTSTGESDVAAATLDGATRLLHGQAPYGHVSEGFHGDSYGLLAYLLYVPGALWTPVTDAWSDLSGSLAIAAAGALLTGLALARLAGTRALLAWLAFPPVLLAASSGANDLVLAAALAWALVLAAHARRSLLLLVAGAWIKLVPVVLVPVWLARVARRRRASAVVPAAGLSVALAAALLALGGTHGIEDMVRAVGFQLQRASFHAPWYAFGVTWLQPVAQAAVLAALVLVGKRMATDPALRRDPARLAALGGGLLLALQLAANYWTWAYLPWVFPFVAVALLNQVRRPAPPQVNGQLVSRKTGHLPGTPLRSWSPRHSKSKPEPTTVP